MSALNYLPVGFRDRRERRVCIQKAMISVIMFLYICALAIAATTPDHINEHATEIINSAVWIIGGLLGLILTIVLAFFTYSQNSNARSQRALIERMDKMDARQDKKEELLLETRRILLELHGEHQAMLHRCEKLSNGK